MELFVFVVALCLATGVAGVRLSFRAHRRIGAVQRLHDGQLDGARRRVAELEAALTQSDAARLRAEEDAFQGRRRHADLIRVVSRQMRTPLEGVLGFSDLLRLNAGGEPLSHRQRQAAERIGEAATRLLTLVEGMSALAEAERPATGQLQRVDPLLLAHRACLPLLQDAEAAKVSLVLPEPQAGLTAMADPERLMRVFADVIAGAVRRSDPGGSVAIQARRLGGEFQVTVRDNGPGLSSAQLETLFQPLAAHAIAVAGEEGTRAPWPGLAPARRRLQAMQGRLEALSAEGRGAAFVISLPSAEGASADTAPNADRLLPELSRLPHGVILYVAKDKAAVALMRRLVQDFGGLQLHVAGCAAEGVAMARDLRPDAVVLDLDMAADAGAAFLEELGRDRTTSCIPVLAVSSDCDVSRLAGVAEVLHRPVSVAGLAQALTRTLGGTSAMRAAS
ncbi:ATP-binding response regulator [Brevundimonas naejangsanensis]